ncbi:MAG: hypothetical protein KDB35_00650 [Acidimicrobiales bacterium]|nr:hypothetical protein [Acidimicrobiales bacterium]MCB1016881.1 hypothetical protein [Acidimicrobiales bacterium]MCB9372535.1 hypothetical protein [Microthrixaceae bacterium]
MTTLTTLAMTFAGISWKPEIRGVLTVAVAVAILCGSVYLLLATNVGSRLGFLVALTALTGWMACLGAVWWMYGQGPQGQIGSWKVIEINEGDLGQAQLEEISSDPDLTEWEELPESDPDRAEAQATVDAALTSGDTARFEATTDYVSIDGWAIGGKPKLEDRSALGRVWYTITDAARITHPTHYAIVQVQPAIETQAIPGQAPPTPTADPSEPVISVIMVRDLGEKRLPAAIVTVSSLILFLVLCYMLHRRDKLLNEHLEDAKLAKAGA